MSRLDQVKGKAKAAAASAGTRIQAEAISYLAGPPPLRGEVTLTEVPMTPDVLRVVRANRQLVIALWLAGAIVAAGLTVASFFAPRTDDYATLGIFFGIPVTVGLAVVALRRFLSAERDLRGKKMAWAVGTITGDHHETHGRGGTERKCSLLLNDPNIGGELAVPIDCSVLELVRPSAKVDTVHDNPFEKEYTLTFDGAVQFVPNSKLLLRLRAQVGDLIYERPGLTAESGTPPSA